MYKLHAKIPVQPPGCVAKMLSTMKLTALLMMLFAMQVSASVYAQKITLKEKNTPLGEVFNKISKQTGYDFLFTTSLLRAAKPVNIDVKNMELNMVLQSVFADQPFDFSIEDRSVVVTPKAKPARPAGSSNMQGLIDIKGTVVDAASGQPIAGATVLVKGTTDGIKTASNGFFLLNNVDEHATIIISSVGYTYRELPAARNMGTVALEMAIKNLREVEVSVNTGYQRIKPEQSTGAVAQISTRAYESRVSTNFLDGLVNRLPGLMINNSVSFTSTTPGSTASRSRSLFNIRGISTMSANQDPLIVVDGYPTELSLNMIDPNEIKSVTILSDAAAATIYGVRASNGVIVIERKLALAGKPRFEFRLTSSITPKDNYNRYRYADNASAIVADYEQSIYAGSVNATTWPLMSLLGGNAIVPRSQVYYLLAQSAAKLITPEQFASSYAALQEFDNKNEYSKLLLRSAVTQTYTVSTSGGTEKALYYIKSNYTRNRLSQRNNDNNSFLFSARTSLKLSPRLSLDLTTDYAELRDNSAPVPGLESLSPYEGLQDVNGQPLYSSRGSQVNPYLNNSLMGKGLQDILYYPLVDVEQISDKSKTVNNKITANFVYNIGKGFGLLFGGIYENSNTDARHYASELSSEARGYIAQYATVDADGTLKYNIPRGGYLRQENSNFYSYTARASLSYNKRIASDHSVNAILGGELRNVVSRSGVASYFGYSDETLLQQPVDYAGITDGTIRGSYLTSSPFYNGYSSLFGQLYNEDRFLSGFSNIVYSFRDKYSVSGSIRVDQSNLFGTNPKYKYKPLWSVGARWNIEKEGFMQQFGWLDQLTLRASYGFNGNVAKLSLPQVIASYTLNQYTSPRSTALQLLSYANSSLRWEQTRILNFGMDYRVLKHIDGTVNYYIKRSTDLLGNSLIDPTIGVSPSIINNASIDNRGIEVRLNADWIARKNFNWNTGFVIARNTSKVLDVYQRVAYNPQTLNSLGYVKGFPVGAMFSYRDAGISSAGFPLITNEKGKIYEVDNSTNNTPQGIMLTNLLSNDTSGVTRYAGSSIPTVNAGLSNRVDIGRFYVFAMVNYYGGFKVRVPPPNPSILRPLEGAGNYWKNPGDENHTDMPNLATYNSGNPSFVYNYSNKYVVNGDYITLGDLTLSYSFDDYQFVKKSGFSHVELKVQGSNLWTKGFNKYNYSAAAGGFQKSYITPTYYLTLFTNF
jgi:TonB-linked SusC/RagA family outer membrane protein